MRPLVPLRFALLAALLALAPTGCGDGDVLPRLAVMPLDPTELDGALESDASTVEDASAAEDAAVQPGDGSLPDGAPLTVERYDYQLDLSSGEVHSAVAFAPTQPGCLMLPAKPILRDVSAEGDGIVQKRNDGLYVCSRTAMPFTVHSKLTLDDTRDPLTAVGFWRQNDRDGYPFRYLLGWLEQCPLFGPCDPTPAIQSHFAFTVDHPPGSVVLCPGARSTERARTTCSLLSTRAPSYSAFMVAAHDGWRATPLTTAAGVNVVLYETEQGHLRTLLDRDAIAHFITWLSELLGPFPYGDELRIASAPVRWLGMEHPANIIVRDDLEQFTTLYEDTPLHTVLHEIAHQWAGDRVTLADTLDYAWKEAVAEYLVYSFEQRERGASAATSTRRVWQRLATNALVPVRPSRTPGFPLGVWSGDVTGSGPMALFLQLEPFLGELTLLRAIQRFLEAPGARGVRALQALLAEESGKNLDRYFDAWIYGDGEPEWPDFHVTSSTHAGQLTVLVTQHHSRAVRFPCSVELQINGDTLHKRAQVEFPLDGTELTATVALPFDEPVRTIKVDPDARLIDWSLVTMELREPVRMHP